MATATPLKGTDALGIGPLAIGNVKYKTEFGLFKRMIEAEKPVASRFPGCLCACARDSPIEPRRAPHRGDFRPGARCGRAARRLSPLVADFVRRHRHAGAAAARAAASFRRPAARHRLRDSSSSRARGTGGEAPPAARRRLGSGFEDRPELVDALARALSAARQRRRRRSAASRTRALLLPTADRLGIAHPAYELEPPADAETGCQARGGAGGTISCRGRRDAQATRSLLPAPRRRRSAVSALFVGDGRRRAIVGFSRQWTASSASARLIATAARSGRPRSTAGSQRA